MSLEFEKINPNKIKITYSKNGKKVVVYASVVKPGSYIKSESPQAGKSVGFQR